MDPAQAKVEQNSFDGHFKPLRPFCDVPHFQSTRVMRVRAELQRVIEETLKAFIPRCEIDYVYPKFEGKDVPTLDISIVADGTFDANLLVALKTAIVTTVRARGDCQETQIIESDFNVTLSCVSKRSDHLMGFLFGRWATDEEEEEAYSENCYTVVPPPSGNVATPLF